MTEQKTSVLAVSLKDAETSGKAAMEAEVERRKAADTKLEAQSKELVSLQEEIKTFKQAAAAQSRDASAADKKRAAKDDATTAALRKTAKQEADRREAAENDLKTRAEEIVSLQKEIKALEETTAIQAQEASAADEQRAAAESSVAEGLRMSIKSEEKRREFAESQLKSQTEEVSHLHDELAHLKEEIEALQESAAAKSHEAAAEEKKRRAAAEEKQNGSASELATLQDQHALELSSANSRIRALETGVFETEQQREASNRKISLLEAEIDQLKEALLSTRRPLTTGASPAATAVASPPVDTLPRPSNPNLISPNDTALNPFELLAKRPVDADLPPASRHARKVSLSMLRARMDSSSGGLGAPLLHPGGGRSGTSSAGARSPSATYAGLGSLGEEEAEKIDPIMGAVEAVEAAAAATAAGGEASAPKKTAIHHQFSDKDGIIWCRCCEGDLIVI